MWPFLTAKTANRLSWLAVLVCSRMAAGQPPVCAAMLHLNGMLLNCPKGPAGNAGNWLFWGAYVVNANTEHPEEAWALVQALTQADTQAKISALGANIPSRVSQEALDAFLTFTPPANNQAFLNGLADSPATEGPLWAGSWPEFAAVMDPAIASLMTGATTMEEFKASICSEANKSFTK